MARRPGQQDDKYHHHCLIRRCLAIVLRRVADDGSPDSREGSAEVPRRRMRTRRPSTISAEERRGDEGPGPPDETGIADGSVTFGELVRENSECYWNPCLVQSVNNLEYKGYITPATLLIAGTEYSLEVVRSAWARRVLRPPRGFDILMLGDMESIEMGIVSQTHFAPLPEALCKVVYDLTSEGTIATMTVITDRLKTAFPELVVPEHNILYRTLGTLIRERKLYHTGHGYSVVTPETYRLLAISPPLERQMLLTNEEAIVRLHGTAMTLEVEDSELCRSAFTQTNQKDMVSAWSSAERILAPSKQVSGDHKVGRLKRSHSLRLLRGKEKEKLIRSNSFRSPTTSPLLNRESRSDPENHENGKKEKSSMFSKLFRRGRGDKSSPKAPKCASFSAQFPPLEWSDPDFVHFHSRATQTLDRDIVLKNKTRSSSLNRMSSRERHSLHLSSTPVSTSWTTNNNPHATDIYHYRSSSLPRKSSPSPNREGVRNHSTRKSPKSSRPQHQHEPQCRVPVTAKPRARYQSPFVPVVSPNNNRNLLKPGERYGDSNALQTSNVLPYRPLSFSSIPPTTLKPTNNPSVRLPGAPSVSAPTWRTTLLPPTTEQKLAVGEPLKKPPIVVLPQRPIAREVASVQPSTTTTTTTTTVQPASIETESKKIMGSPRNISSTREVHLGGTVDVQISVEPKISTQMKKGLLNTDLDSDVNKDLLKIATTWNHSISNKSPTSKTGITNSGMNPMVTTTTSITTSMSHKGLKKEGQKVTSVELPQKDISIVTSSPGQTLKNSTLIDCAEKCTILNDLEENKLHLEPRSKMADAKAAFFSESPTPSQQLLKDDSGFSSSASTSRPMSVSPC